MKGKLLILFLIFGMYNGFSQATETITIDWGRNSTPTASGNANTARTIEVGDTVEWNWYSTGFHNVVSSSGGTETFNSGSTTSNPGVNFSYTFNTVGSTDFICQPHSGDMFGTITVVAEGTLSTSSVEESLKNVSLYPNPVKNILSLKFPTNLREDLNIEIYNVLGKRIKSVVKSNEVPQINVSDLSKGVYLIKIYSTETNSFITKRFIRN